MRSALALLLLCGCTQVNAVQIVVPDEAVGLSCIDSATGDSLFRRAMVSADSAEASVVLDYMYLEGVPSCRAVQLVRWCEARGCPVLHRDCVRVRLSPIPDPEEIQDTVERELAALSPITHDAPDGFVSIRATLTTQTCEELAWDDGFPAPRCDSLLGCVYSCPVVLDGVTGDVELELDVLSGICTELEVGICAGIGHSGGCR